MSWCRRAQKSRFRRAAFLITVFLAGCGFQPVLAPGGAAISLNGNVDVTVVDGRENFEFRRRILDRLSDPVSSAAFRIDYDLRITESAVTVSSDSDIERFTLLGLVSFQMIETATGDAVLTDRVRATTGYSATTDTFPTQIAERDARIRLATALADQLVQVLQLNADILTE
ncbi:MAG: hypothetical protein AAF826_01685 [Pseudomonadota bacterium]